MGGQIFCVYYNELKADEIIKLNTKKIDEAWLSKRRKNVTSCYNGKIYRWVMTIKEVIDMLILSPNLLELDLKVQIGNKYIDIDSLHIEEDMVILHIPTK